MTYRQRYAIILSCLLGGCSALSVSRVLAVHDALTGIALALTCGLLSALLVLIALRPPMRD